METRRDFLVCVDRSVKLSYPGTLVHECSAAGPTEYNLLRIKQWLHDEQKYGSVVGNIIYQQLQKGDNITTCLNLEDGLAIQAKGITIFRKLFADKAVFLWGSVVQDRNNRLVVPFLYEFDGEVVLRWHWLRYSLGSQDPALRFSK